MYSQGVIRKEPWTSKNLEESEAVGETLGGLSLAEGGGCKPNWRNAHLSCNLGS